MCPFYRDVIVNLSENISVIMLEKKYSVIKTHLNQLLRSDKNEIEFLFVSLKMN